MIQPANETASLRGKGSVPVRSDPGLGGFASIVRPAAKAGGALSILNFRSAKPPSGRPSELIAAENVATLACAAEDNANCDWTLRRAE